MAADPVSTLNNILDDLSFTNNATGESINDPAEKSVEEPINDPVETSVEEPINDPVEKPAEEPASDPDEESERQVIHVSSHQAAPSKNENDDSNIDNQCDAAINELLNNYRSDRTELSNLIDVLRHKINTDSPARPTRIYYEAITQALKTRSESNTNLIKLIETLIKRSSKSSNIDSLPDFLDDE